MQLRDMSRDPFLVVLSEAMLNGPTGNDFKRMASEAPHRWAQTVKILANLGGFSDRRELRSDIYTHMSSLTDSQLEEAINQLETGEIVDITDYKVVEG